MRVQRCCVRARLPRGIGSIVRQPGRSRDTSHFAGAAAPCSRARVSSHAAAETAWQALRVELCQVLGLPSATNS